MIFTLYIFDRKDQCVYYNEWNRSRPRPENVKGEEKLLAGFLQALKSFVSKTSPFETATFESYTTTTYKLHFFETGTGIKFVLTTDPKTNTLGKELRDMYRDFYVKYVVKNPLYTLGTPITCSAFHMAVDQYIKSLPSF